MDLPVSPPMIPLSSSPMPGLRIDEFLERILVPEAVNRLIAHDLGIPVADANTERLDSFEAGALFFRGADDEEDDDDNDALVRSLYTPDDLEMMKRGTDGTPEDKRCDASAKYNRRWQHAREVELAKQPKQKEPCAASFAPAVNVSNLPPLPQVSSFSALSSISPLLTAARQAEATNNTIPSSPTTISSSSSPSISPLSPSSRVASILPDPAPSDWLEAANQRALANAQAELVVLANARTSTPAEPDNEWKLKGTTSITRSITESQLKRVLVGRFSGLPKPCRLEWACLPPMDAVGGGLPQQTVRAEIAPVHQGRGR
ncbi:hypothetical protein JCM11641_006443 [Rhodosporidiobolus odoratus]